MRRILAAIVALLLIALPALAQSDPELTLIDPPTVDNDRVTLGVRLSGVDPRNFSVLSAANFGLSEPYTNLTIVPEPRLPVTVGVLVNLSVNSDLALIQRTLHAYFDAYYREGDDVTFTLLTGRAPTTVAAATKTEIDTVIDTMALSPIYFNVGDELAGLAESLEQAQADDPDRAVFGLLVTSFINNDSEVDGADSFTEASIPLHVVQAHQFRQNFTESLREMASRTGGIFVNNQAGSLVIGEVPEAVGPLKVLFDALESSRIVFDVSYTSTALDLTANPQVTLRVQLGANEVLALPFTYERQFEPPVVEFANPNITAARRPSRLDGGGTAFDAGEVDIAVYVRYPDAVPRRIESLQLQVTDLSRNVVAQSQLLVNPQTGSDGAFHITWDLSDYVSPGTNTPVAITVTVTDELGLMASVEQRSSVTIAALPPLPTATPMPPTATFTPVPPSPTPVPPTAVPTAVPVVVAQTSQIGRNLPVSTDQLVTSLAVISVAFAGIVAALLLRVRRLRRQLRTVSAGGSARMYADSRMEIPTPLPSGDVPLEENDETDNRIVGRLIVKRGLPQGEIPVNASEFVIGRKSGDGISYAIDAPFVSPRHCMITFRNNRFLIRDLGSKNGTFVNGERILPERDTIVPNGSEVEITKQIVFELWDPDTVVRIDYQMDDARTERLNSRISTTTAVDSVAFPSALGIRAADDDDGEIGEDYSPV